MDHHKSTLCIYLFKFHHTITVLTMTDIASKYIMKNKQGNQLLAS